MALITCLECGGQVSDKAYACPHCGYPLKEPTDNAENTVEKAPTAYALVLDNTGPAKVKCIKVVYDNLHIDLKSAKDLCDNIPSEGTVLLKSKDQSKLEEFKKQLDAEGSLSHIETIKDDGTIEMQENKDAPVKCPRCGSTQITTGMRGYSLLWGPLGSNKTVNRCAKCGYSWTP